MLVRHAGILLLLLVLAAPSVVALALGAGGAVGTLGLGAVVGVLARVLGGARVGATVLAATAALTFLAVLATPSPAAVGVVFAVAGAGVGISARWGRGAAVSQAPVIAAFAASGASGLEDAAVHAALIAAGGLWAFALASALIAKGVLPQAAARPPARHVWVYAVALGLLAGLGNWLVADLDVAFGPWINLTLFVVAAPGFRDTASKTARRSAGTLAGGVLALVLGLVFPPAAWPVLAALAITLMIAVMSSSYVLYATYLTAGMVLLQGDDQVELIRADGYRLAWTLLTSAVVFLVALAIRALWRAAGGREGATG